MILSRDIFKRNQVQTTEKYTDTIKRMTIELLNLVQKYKNDKNINIK